jgi:hypothetical protein
MQRVITHKWWKLINCSSILRNTCSLGFRLSASNVWSKSVSGRWEDIKLPHSMFITWCKGKQLMTINLSMSIPSNEPMRHNPIFIVTMKGGGAEETHHVSRLGKWTRPFTNIMYMVYACCIRTSTQHNHNNSIIIHISHSRQCPYCIIDLLKHQLIFSLLMHHHRLGRREGILPLPVGGFRGNRSTKAGAAPTTGPQEASAWPSRQHRPLNRL